MGKFSRDKGGRVERELVNKLRVLGFTAERVPLSGATTYAKGDVRVIVGGEQRFIEVKARAAGWKTLYDVLAEAEAAVQLDQYMLAHSFNDILFAAPNVAREASTREKTVLATLDKLRGGCQYLALKANGKPFLFVSLR